MKKYIFLASIVLVILVLSSCFLIQKPQSATIQLISPANGSTNVSTDVALSWQISNNSQSANYEIFLGTTSNPPLFATSDTTQIKISNLSYSTLYYWKVEATFQDDQSAGQNSGENIASQIQTFTTEPSSQASITLVIGTIPATIGGNENFSLNAVVYHKFALLAATAIIGNISIGAVNLNSSTLTFEFGSSLKSLKSGFYTITVQVEDINDDIALARRSVYINNSLPQISFVTVLATVDNGQTETVSVIATALGSGNCISSVEIGGIQAAQSAINPAIWNASITFEGTGVQTLYATAIDNFNNVSSTSAHIVYTLSVIIPDTTKVLNQSSIQHLTYVSTNQSIFVFTGASSQITSLEPGDVIVSGVNGYTPQGALRKIVSIKSNPANNTITVYTTSTTLNQAIQQGSLYSSVMLSPDQVESIVPSKGTKITPVYSASKNEGSSYSETFTYQISHTFETSATNLDLTVSATGSISFTLGFNFGVDISMFGNSAYFTVNQSEQAELLFSADLSWSANVITPVATIYFDPITVYIGIVPVVINPYMVIYVGANGNLSIDLSAGVIQQENFTLGEQYSNNSWAPINSFTNTLNCMPPVVQAACNFTGDVSPQMGIQLYWGLGSLYIQPEAYLTFSAQYYQQFGGNNNEWLWWKLVGGLQAMVGADVGWGLVSYQSPPLFNYSLLILQSAPSAPVVTISSTSDNSVTLSWKEASPNINGFYISRSYNEGPFAQIATVPQGVTTYKDSSITESGDYAYEISSYSTDLLGINTSTSTPITINMSNVHPIYYSVSGYVYNAGGAGIQGVTITFSNNATSSITSSNGYWIQNQLSGTVVIIPSLSGYEFTPHSTTVTGPSSNVNFIGTPSIINSSLVLQGFSGQGATPESTTQWPILLTGQSAQQYWSSVQPNDSQQVLEMVGNEQNYAFWSVGTVIFNSSYNGSSLTVSASGVYTSTSGWIADGYEVGMFMTPNSYIANSNAVAYWVSSTEFGGESYLFNTNPPQGVFGPLTSSGLQGDIMFPYSPTPYIMVQWDPVFSQGQFDIFIVSCTNPNTLPNFVTYSNIGNGGFEPNPGDILSLTVNYSSNTNSINASMEDMNTSQVATVTVTLPNNFSPPEAGTYALSISGNSGDGSANWGLLNWNASTGSLSTFQYKLKR